jgi:hypothetical protein
VHYTLLYDVTQAPWPGRWLAVVAALVSTATMGCIVAYRRLPSVPLYGGQAQIPGGLFGGLFFGFASLQFTFMALDSYDSHRTLLLAARSGQDTLVEGQLDYVRVSGPKNHEDVELSVAGQSIRYSGNPLGGHGYREFPPNPALQRGRRVRIRVVGAPNTARQITRLEVE